VAIAPQLRAHVGRVAWLGALSREGSQTLISQTGRLRPSSPFDPEFICRTGARIGRSRRSIPLLVLHTPLGTPRGCRAAEAVSPFDCSRDPVRHPSRVPAVQASASAILNFDSRPLSLVNSPILLVERRR